MISLALKLPSSGELGRLYEGTGGLSALFIGIDEYHTDANIIVMA